MSGDAKVRLLTGVAYRRLLLRPSVIEWFFSGVYKDSFYTICDCLISGSIELVVDVDVVQMPVLFVIGRWKLESLLSCVVRMTGAGVSSSYSGASLTNDDLGLKLNNLTGFTYACFSYPAITILGAA